MIKSALEIALEKTQMINDKEYFTLNKEQREKIDKINKEYDIKVAELEIKFSSKLKEMKERCGEEEFNEHVSSFYREFENERNKINEERRNKIDKIKGR